MSNDLKLLKELYPLVKEYTDKKELVNNNRILFNNYYKNIFHVNNLSEEKPKLYYSLIVLVLVISISINIPLLGEKYNYIAIPIVSIISLLFICLIINNYYKKLNKWNKIYLYLNELKKQYIVDLESLEKQIEKYDFLLPKELLLYSNDIYNYMQNNKLTNIDDALNIIFKDDENKKILLMFFLKAKMVIKVVD